MKKTLFIACILCTQLVSAQWSRINNSPKADNIYFVNSQIGYATKSDSVFKTLDGGITWNNTNASFPLYTQLGRIEFTSKDTGFVSSADASTFMYLKSIFMTINGGLSWSRIVGPYGGNIDFHIAGQNDYYFHVTSHPGDSVFHTTNGGVSFSKTGNTNTVIYNQQINNLIVYSDSVSSTGLKSFYKSTDGGASWSLILSDNTIFSAFKDYQFLNNNDGYILLYQYNGSDTIDSKIYKTSDGGLNWNSYKLPSTISGPQNIHFTNVNTGYILSNQSGMSQIYKTTDAGQTWNLDFSGNSNEYFGDIGIVEYFGKLYLLGNTIITNNTSTSVNDINNEKPSFNLYPNPTNGQFIIKSNSFENKLDYVIFDMTGKEVYEFSTQKNLTEAVDVSFLNKGLYIVRDKAKFQSIFFVKE